MGRPEVQVKGNATDVDRLLAGEGTHEVAQVPGNTPGGELRSGPALARRCRAG